MTHAAWVRILGPWREREGPLYQRLAAALGEAIDRGELSPAARLPAERSLAERLDLSRTTVVAAYERLRQEGRVESRQGSGTRVTRSAARAAAPREAAAAVLSGRNVVFRAFVERSRAEVELLGSHLGGMPDMLAAALRAARRDLATLAAGPGYLPMGLPALRKAVARHLASHGLPTSDGQVLLTSGAQQAISLVASLFVESGDAVVLEDPTYLGAIDAFAASGARLLGALVDADGIRSDALREAVTRTTARVAYLVATCHNPTGAILPESRRREVARLADETGLVVVEDMTLADLALEGSPPPPVAAFARGGTVLTVGSLSKLFWGGLRVGWIRGPEAVVSRLARMKVVADLGGSLLSQAVAVRILDRTRELVSQRRKELRTRLDFLAGLLAKHLPSFSYPRPSGGLSLWVRLPAGDASELAQVAQRHGVAIVPGIVCSPEARHADRIRLPFAVEPETIEEGVRRLARAWREYTPTRGTPAKDTRAPGVLV